MTALLDRAQSLVSGALGSLRRQAATAHAYQAVFDTPEGKTVIFDLLRAAGVLETSADPADSRFYDGRRSVGLHILDRLRWRESEMVQLAEMATKTTLNDLEGE